MSDPTRQRLELPALINIAERELQMRYRVYAGRVKRGEMSQADSDFEISGIRQIRNILRILLRHQGAVRALIEHEQHCEKIAAEVDQRVENMRAQDHVPPYPDDVDAIKDHPAVGAVLDAFPDAQIAAVRRTGNTP